MKRILAPIDGSVYAERAFQQAVMIAAAFKATVTALHVIKLRSMQKVEDESVAAPSLDRAKKLFAGVEPKAKAAGVELETRTVASRDVARTIIDEATDGEYDLIVIASHGTTGFRRLILGSVTDEVLRESTVPVLVMK
jgi:nucleotide-binding universal stress UspA family protein